MSFEIGQRVLFRSLQWEVEDAPAASLVTLFGRDRLNQGRRIRVVPGLEPIKRAEVPSLDWTIDRPGWNPIEWKALHDAFRLTLSHGRGNLAAVDWGRLVLEPYQLVPLLRMERLPFPRLLLADDTGLGKTAEAGLILFRLIQKRRADRILILCRARPEPERWHDELKEKFGLDFTVVNDAEDYARLRREIPSHLNVFGHLPRVAMSMFFAAPSKRGSHIADDLRRVHWDVAVVDEAHHLAVRADPRKRLGELGRIAAETSDALLLLTATPHDGKNESYASLLRLLDPYLVIDPDRIDPALVRPYVVRRLKSRVVLAGGKRFRRRRIQVLDVPGTPAENHLDKGLRGYCNELKKRAAELEKTGEMSRARGAKFLESFFRRRMASSAHACRLSLERRIDRLTRNGPSESSGDREEPEDRDSGPLDCESQELPSGKSELDVLRELHRRAERIAEGSEAKTGALVRLLDEILVSAADKVVVFTEFADTLDMLARHLGRDGWGEWNLEDEAGPPPTGRGLFFRYEGETPKKRRETIRKTFLGDPRVRILLATDAASESINLQKTCHHLIHFEAVWNPNRYEQRNGRIDRYGGQDREPRIYLLLNPRSIDQKVAAVGYEKMETIAATLESASNVLPLASRVDFDAFLERFGEAEEEIVKAAAEFDRLLDESARESVAEMATDEAAELVRGEAFEESELREVEEALERSRAFVPEFRDVEAFLKEYLKNEGGKIDPVAGEDDVYRIAVPPVHRNEIGDRIARATFRRDLAIRESDDEEERRVEFLSPGHALVQAALRRARGWVYRAGYASRISYRRVARDEPAGFVFTYALRFVDGRGQLVAEHFEAVAVTLGGKASTDAEADLSLLLGPTSGNVTTHEEKALRTKFRDAFPRAREVAMAGARERAESRRIENERAQDALVAEALERLGAWKAKTEERLRQKADVELSTRRIATQLEITGDAAREHERLRREKERKIQAFREEQSRLLVEEKRRREEILAMRSIRLDSLDAIGALAIVPEGSR
ncbi:MAG: DEAD/DEAH box helicase family protein [Planctomycetes bacterium]|nr:DEAD/DEAH box helicase family protein [Planctomycetota bacterium]